MYPYSSNYNRTAYGRPKVSALYCDNYAVPDFEQTIALDDDLALGLLPFYLAAQLMSGENDNLASWFMTQYRENLNDFKRTGLSSFESIDTPYGLF